MTITIGKPCAICEIGGRQNNEDSIYPLPEAVTTDQQLFIVCDGVGGADKGEVASALACESLHTYFSTFLEGEPTNEFINKAVRYIEARFDSYVVLHPEAKGMATTLTMLYVGTSGVILAHIGDSRIYHFRNGVILHQTEDHSLVNSLLKLGQITEAELLTHPQRNVILRAIQGTDHSVEADIVCLKDIQPGDYFFMCTDGVLEQAVNLCLSSVFTGTHTAEYAKDALMDICNGKTRDNFSFYVIPVSDVNESAGFKQFLISFLYSFV
ncbi:MAG: protein phosphatase 2C domain-containing protein [Tannerellaceae bacterium]